MRKLSHILLLLAFGMYLIPMDMLLCPPEHHCKEHHHENAPKPELMETMPCVTVGHACQTLKPATDSPQPLIALAAIISTASPLPVQKYFRLPEIRCDSGPPFEASLSLRGPPIA